MNRRSFLKILKGTLAATASPKSVADISSRVLTLPAVKRDKLDIVFREMYLFLDGISTQNRLEGFEINIPRKTFSIPEVQNYCNTRTGNFDYDAFEGIRKKIGTNPKSYFLKFLKDEDDTREKQIAINHIKFELRDKYHAIPSKQDMLTKISSIDESLKSNGIVLPQLSRKELFESLSDDLKPDFANYHGGELYRLFERDLKGKYKFKSITKRMREEGFTTQFDRYDELVTLHPLDSQEWMNLDQYQHYFLQITASVVKGLDVELSLHFLQHYMGTPVARGFDITVEKAFIENYLVKELYEPNGQKLLFEELHMEQSWLDATYQGLKKVTDDVKSFTQNNPGTIPESIDSFLEDVSLHRKSDE